MGIIESRGVKQNQAAAFELRTIGNGIDVYWQRLLGTRGCRVPDFCDISTQSNVNELGTTQRLNDWVAVALLQAHRAFSSSGWTHNSSTRVRKGRLSEDLGTYGKTMTCLLLMTGDTG
jgi:hypothetical protein